MDATATSLNDDALGLVLRDYVAAAERLQQTHVTLQSEVERLRRELASKDRELERRRRLAAIGELAAGVAHEVRNPLGAMQLYSGLLRNAVGDGGPALELVEKIERGIRAIDRVVRDTLALAPSRASFAPCRLLDLVERAADVCRPALENAGVHLNVAAADPQLEVPADADGLQRVLVNLIANAVDAAPGGSEIAVHISDAADGSAEIRVCDRGPGLSDELLERLFDPFVTTKAHGTGLGLSIAFRLVEAHGGRLSAANRAGGGAEFTITLPRDDAAADRRPDEADGPQRNGNGAGRRTNAA